MNARGHYVYLSTLRGLPNLHFDFAYSLIPFEDKVFNFCLAAAIPARTRYERNKICMC